jgi:hypothetical protein
MVATAECIKQVANFTNVATNFKLDNAKFSPKNLEEILAQASPKLDALFAKIEELDKADKKKHKHCIYVDFKGIYAKIVASAFIAKDYKLVYDKNQKLVDLDSGDKNFIFLSSATIYGKPFSVRLRKNLMEIFNKRPDNVHGEQIRFIILDSGFREGLDCFDVKYVHILQNLVTPSDEKQAIGRSTRMCGQQGLTFDPKRGWPLHVFKYEVNLPIEYNAKDMFELYLQYSKLDLRQIVLSAEFDKIIQEVAADASLTKAVHTFSVNKAGADADADAITGGKKQTKLIKKQNGVVQRPKDHHKLKPGPLTVHRTFNGVGKFVKEHFVGEEFKWGNATLENKCIVTGGNTIQPQIVEFTPSQNFMRYYFQPQSIYKGMLVNWSVGTGKTCLGIAVASTSWEKKGYTIIWVTRHTLKADIWKNMFTQVCSLVIQKEKNTYTLPLKKSPKHYLSDAWVEPISFKQFSNLCEGKNEIYRTMKKRNGEADPLRKTLIILDEAHKLFAKDVIGTEKPNTPEIIKAIQHSYKTSKADSVRVLLMTATPYTSNPMDFVRLLNIIREDHQQLPDNFDDFGEKYLKNTGKFNEDKKPKFLDEISGQISYLNREKDARQFAYPVFNFVNVNMSMSEVYKYKTKLEESKLNIAEQEETIQYLKDEKALVKKDKKEALDGCKTLKVKDRKGCKEDIEDQFKATITEIDDKIKLDTEKMKQLKNQVKKITGDMKEAAKNDFSQETALQKCIAKKK